jgi:hypothetical protein
MVLDLIASLSNEENFLTTLGGQQPRSIPSKVRRLSLQTNKEEDTDKIPTIILSSVRSLTVFSRALSLLPALSSFPVLRTLDLSGCAELGNLHLKDICNLFHLRFLSLEGTYITEIPREIGNLHLLQMLDIRSTRMKKLPSTFVQLRQLVYIDMGDRWVSTLLLRSMSTLPHLSFLAILLEELRMEDLQVLGSMPSLHDLLINVMFLAECRYRRLVIDNGCPFRRLTRLHIENGVIDFRFARGTLQQLQILELDFDEVETKDRFGNFHFGLENLPSLGYVYVKPSGGGALTEAMSNALRKVLDINPNKPTLTVKVTSCYFTLSSNMIS